MDDTRWIVNLLRAGDVVVGPVDFLDYINEDTMLIQMMEDPKTQSATGRVVEASQAKCIFAHRAANDDNKEPTFLSLDEDPEENLILVQVYNDGWNIADFPAIHFLPLFDLRDELGCGPLAHGIHNAPVYCTALRMKSIKHGDTVRLDEEKH